MCVLVLISHSADPTETLKNEGEKAILDSQVTFIGIPQYSFLASCLHKNTACTKAVTVPVKKNAP